MLLIYLSLNILLILRLDNMWKINILQLNIKLIINFGY